LLEIVIAIAITIFQQNAWSQNTAQKTQNTAQKPQNTHSQNLRTLKEREHRGGKSSKTLDRSSPSRMTE
jgi:hypothetical protein